MSTSRSKFAVAGHGEVCPRCEKKFEPGERIYFKEWPEEHHWGTHSACKPPHKPLAIDCKTRFKRFASEHISQDDTTFVLAADVYAAYEAWCAKRNEPFMWNHDQEFPRQLGLAYLYSYRVGWKYLGIRLNGVGYPINTKRTTAVRRGMARTDEERKRLLLRVTGLGMTRAARILGVGVSSVRDWRRKFGIY